MTHENKISNFDVLKRMGEENLNIQLCSTVTEMNYSAKLGTKVTVGVPGNVCFDIESGQLNVMLLLFDMNQFKELKTKMELESR